MNSMGARMPMSFTPMQVDCSEDVATAWLRCRIWELPRTSRGSIQGLWWGAQVKRLTPSLRPLRMTERVSQEGRRHKNLPTGDEFRQRLGFKEAKATSLLANELLSY